MHVLCTNTQIAYVVWNAAVLHGRYMHAHSTAGGVDREVLNANLRLRNHAIAVLKNLESPSRDVNIAIVTFLARTASTDPDGEDTKALLDDALTHGASAPKLAAQVPCVPCVSSSRRCLAMNYRSAQACARTHVRTHAHASAPGTLFRAYSCVYTVQR